jgi:Zn-dependent peptidase ImmA (M78 family)
MKITNDKILEMLENNVTCKDKMEICAEYDITIQTLNRRLAKMRDKVKDKVKELAEKNAIDYFNHLVAQSKQGKTQATALLMELSGVKQTINIADGQWNILINKVIPGPAADSEAKKE